MGTGRAGRLSRLRRYETVFVSGLCNGVSADAGSGASAGAGSGALF
jgi:hypothetical protein